LNAEALVLLGQQDLLDELVGELVIDLLLVFFCQR